MKCYNCGHEFEGKFCPECGARAIELPQKCPNCGKDRQGEEKFCTECGYSFFPKPQTNDTAIPKSVGMLATLYRALPAIPAYAFAVFSLILFILFCAPVASLLGISDNVYTLLGDSAVFVVLLIIAILGLLFAAFAVCTLFVPNLKFKNFTIKKLNFTLNNLNAVIECVILLIYLILSCIACVIVNSVWFLSVGACPILIIIFSFLLILAIIGTFVAQHYLNKSHTEFKAEAERNYLEQHSAYIDNVRQMQSYFVAQCKPVAPDPVNQPMIKERKTVARYERFKKRSLCYLCLPTFFIGIISSIVSCFFVKHSPSDWNPAKKIRSKGLKTIIITGTILLIVFLILFIIASFLYVNDLSYNYSFGDLVLDITCIPFQFIAMAIEYWKYWVESIEDIGEYIQDMTIYNTEVDYRVALSIYCFLYQLIWLFFVTLGTKIYRNKLNMMFYGEKKPKKNSTPILQYCNNKEYAEQLAAYKTYKKEQKTYLKRMKIYEKHMKKLKETSNTTT